MHADLWTGDNIHSILFYIQPHFAVKEKLTLKNIPKSCSDNGRAPRLVNEFTRRYMLGRMAVWVMVNCTPNRFPWFKGTLTICFAISFYNVYECLCLLELIFTVKPQGLHVLLGDIQQYIYVLCDSFLNYQMALSFNINNLSGDSFIARPN